MTESRVGGDPGPSVRVTEIFHSIQGESTRAGLPCTFVRLTGCPLRCVWCDTAYAFHGGRRMTIDEVLHAVARRKCGLVEITGGEPLVQPGAAVLAGRLVDDGYTVLVETSGALDVSVLDDRVHRIMDLKCPGSGEERRNLWSNLNHLTGRDEVKFVVADPEDFEWAAAVIRRHRLDERVRVGSLGALLVSPVWGMETMEELAGAILASGLPVRFQTQLHKHIWGPDRAGV
ncbi:MAG: radical SAM protein [Gemmatimonadota bacterium]|nr:radical SAM protein [Gemmatimonadota bacterium]MDE2870391.1 radical SAM protein [Gemmatimonadota bacterium]